MQHENLDCHRCYEQVTGSAMPCTGGGSPNPRARKELVRQHQSQLRIALRDAAKLLRSNTPAGWGKDQGQ